MGGDGAEGTASETATMDVDGELDHVVGRNALAFVLGHSVLQQTNFRSNASLSELRTSTVPKAVNNEIKTSIGNDR